MRQEWISFNKGNWTKEIDVRDFIQKNYTPYDGDDAFLAGPTKATQTLWDQVMELTKQEQEKWRCAGYGHKNHFHYHLSRPGIFK